MTLYDLSNTYMEGQSERNEAAQFGRFKEKRSDCPLVTLGLVLDGSGFVRRSRTFEGNVSEGTTLEVMLKGLQAPPGALVIMDAGIATQANIDWLIEHAYCYLVVRRGGVQSFDAAQSVVTQTQGGETVRLQKALSADGKELELYCPCEGRQAKEEAMVNRFCTGFEAGLQIKEAGINDSWATLRKTLQVQRRTTTSMRRADGRTLHVRKTCRSEPALMRIYQALGITASPGGVKKLVV